VEWDFENDTVTENTTLYGKWVYQRTWPTYKITYVATQGGFGDETEEVLRGSKLTRYEGVTGSSDINSYFYYTGEIFKDAACTAPWDFENDTVDSDLTLYKKWYEGYLVTLDYGEYSGDDWLYLMQGQLLKSSDLAFKAITVDGASVSGWYYDEQLQNPVDLSADIEVTENITLYAKFETGIKVQLDTLNMTANTRTSQIVLVPYGEKITEPAVTLPDGYSIIGDKWIYEMFDETGTSTGQAKWNFENDVVTEPITLFTTIAKDPVITFDVQGLGTAPAQETVVWGSGSEFYACSIS